MSDQEIELPPNKKQKLDIDNSNTETEENLTDVKKEKVTDYSEDINEVGNEGFSLGESKYNDFVSAEEIEKLKEFQVLDELKSNDEDSDDEESESSDGKSEGVPEEEIEKMLDEDLPEDFKGAPKPKPFHTRQKIILEEKGINYFEVLPLDWMMVRHHSGMPVYMHRGTRVCTLAKPYALGKGNTRRHDIPISAIPCLNYRKALEEEAKQNEKDRKITEQIKNGTWRKTANEPASNTDKSKETNTNKNADSLTASVDNVTKESDKQPQESMEINHSVDTDTANRTECPFAHASAAASDKDEDIDKSKETSVDKDENIDKNKESVDKDENIDKNKESVDKGENIDINKESVYKGKDIDKSKGTSVDNNVDKSKETSVDESSDPSAQPVVLPGGLVMLPPRVETVNTSWKTQHLTPEQFNDYCKALFKFKTVNILHFMRWADRRKYTKARKTLQYPTLPEGTKLITIPAQPTHNQNGGGVGSSGAGGGGAGRNKRDWVMNMNGRSYLSVFHEYVRRALEKQPVYEFKQLENAATPYQATVYIGGMQYGSGRGTSKRLAKSAAARASIQILIPEAQLDPDPAAASPSAAAAAADQDFSFFDYVGIEDPRMSEFCAATCEPSPHAILRTCLLRNFGAGDRHIHTEMKKLEYQKISLTMKVGKHSATVVCKNKKTAKQRASQAILQALHPHVRSWGSLLRLYGSRSLKSCKERKLEEQQITLLQDKARRNEPNYAVLDKLRQEMTRLAERDRAVVSIGTLLVPSSRSLPLHSGSNLNNVDL